MPLDGKGMFWVGFNSIARVLANGRSDRTGGRGSETSGYGRDWRNYLIHHFNALGFASAVQDFSQERTSE